MTQYFERLLATVSECVLSMDVKKFEALANQTERVLRSGNKVVVSGLGKNVPVCEKFVGTMNSFGLEARYVNTNSAAHGDVGMIKDGDLTIVLTKSGETSESVYLVELLQNRKTDTNVWLLTFTSESRIEKMIGKPHCLVLTLKDEGDKWNIVPNNSTTVNLIVLQGLAMTLADRMGITLADFKMNHPGGYIGAQLKDVK